ncbi:MAG: hypothetical protein SGI72_03325 [Planctomycetota bacterium]|nr:hypothetical protein [Planctomycetota bacterium]
MKHAHLLALCCLLAPSCSDSEPVTKAASANVPAGLNSSVAGEPAAPAVAARVHVHTPRLDRLRRALTFGDTSEVAGLLDASNDAGVEAPLLRARALALDAKGTIEALRLVQTVREIAPSNPEVYATAAEIYASRSSFESGWQEVERGLAACGESAEFSRARGVLWISRENGAKKGLEHLERARTIDADLPFMERALGQAHLLVAKFEAQAGRKESALEHARASLSFDPDDVDAKRFLSDAYADALDFQAAIAVLSGLVQDGRPLASELASLHKKAGMSALLEHDRGRALDHFVAARELGLDDTELASGAALLDQEARLETEKGLAALEKRDLAAAEVAFRAAVRYEPGMLAPRNHLGVALYARGQFGEAAALWRSVLKEARAEGLVLPDPVHMNLARALKSAGESAAARAALDEYLALEPEGVWRAETLALRESLETAR